MNVLSPEKRALILALKAEGATIREIAADVGCHKETVRGYLNRMAARQAEIRGRLEAFEKEVTERGAEWVTELDSYLGLFYDVFLRCPLHPEAEPIEEVEGSRCSLCHRDGMKRHHARRKASGRPIVPPWRRKATGG